MRRIASHYIYWRKWYRMHYLELDAKGRLTGVYPLVQEIANTEFYDGTLIAGTVRYYFSSGWSFFFSGMAGCYGFSNHRLSGTSLSFTPHFPDDA